MEQIAKALSAKTKTNKKGKRKVTYSFQGSEKDSDERYADEKFYFNFAIYSAIAKRNVQEITSKTVNRLTTELIVQIVSPTNERDKAVRCLLDTGTSQSMILKKFVPLSINVSKSAKPITWTTLSGTLVTEKLAEMKLKIPELSTGKEINWTCHVDEVSERDKVPYDIILGLDFLTELGFVLDFENKTIKWGDSQTIRKSR